MKLKGRYAKVIVIVNFFFDRYIVIVKLHAETNKLKIDSSSRHNLYSLFDVWALGSYVPEILLQLGFDSLFFARIDYQDRARRKDEKTLEVVWQGSKSLLSTSQVRGLKFFGISFVFHFV